MPILQQQMLMPGLSRRRDRTIFEFAAPEWAVGYREDSRGRRAPFVATIELGLRWLGVIRFPSGCVLSWADDQDGGGWTWPDGFTGRDTAARFAGALSAGGRYTVTVKSGRSYSEVEYGGQIDWLKPLMAAIGG